MAIRRARHLVISFLPYWDYLIKWVFAPLRLADIRETASVLKDMMARYNPETTFGNNLANHIAQSIYHAIPVIYAATPYLTGVPVRWRNQFNENAKTVAYSNFFPELTHNEIVGWEALEGVTKHFRVIFLSGSGRDRSQQTEGRNNQKDS